MWDLIGGFNTVPDWHPAVEKSELDQGGKIRRLSLVGEWHYRRTARTSRYHLHVPEGTFYLLVRSPWDDDWAFAELLAAHRILVLLGSVVELPGCFRVSLTTSDAMIDRSVSGFAAAITHAHTNSPR